MYSEAKRKQRLSAAPSALPRAARRVWAFIQRAEINNKKGLNMLEIKTKKNSNRGRKALPIAKKQRHQVNSRLNDFEILQVDKLRGNVSRGEYLRRAAFNNAPKIIPEINLKAWSELSKSAANLNQLAKNSHTAEPQISEILEILAEFRLTLIGAKL